MPQRFVEAVFAQLLAIGVPPDMARRECDVMQPLAITATTLYANRRSLQANLKDYAWQVEWMMGEGATLAIINVRLTKHILSINGKLEYPREFVLRRLSPPGAGMHAGEAG